MSDVNKATRKSGFTRWRMVHSAPKHCPRIALRASCAGAIARGKSPCSGDRFLGPEYRVSRLVKMNRQWSFIFVFFVLLALPASTHAQMWSGIIDSSRAIDWSQAGAGTIPARTTICSTLSPGATLSQINSAIAGCPSGQTVFLSAGTYVGLSGQINLKSNVTLRGAGPDQTFLVFISIGGCNGLGGALCAMNSDTNYSGDPHNVATWTSGYTPGSTSITLGAVTTGSIGNLHVGSLLILDQDPDAADTGTIYVCQQTTGCSQQGGIGCGIVGPKGHRVQMQQVQVTSISGNGPWTIGITPGIYAPNWRSSQNPGAWWSSALPITGVGIENMSLDYTAVATVPNGGGGIMFSNASYSWVKNVRSVNNALGNHVWEYQSSHITVRDSYFYGGSGTSGNYGVDSGCSCSDNLTENDIFQHLATATITEGSAGSVFGYNFAADDFYTAVGGSAPGWQQEDAYHHQAGDNFILWEGQIGSGFTADDIHGSSFMLTAFRNRWSGRDPAITLGIPKTQQTIGMSLFAYNRYLNVIGNVLGTAGYHTIYASVPSSASDPGNASNSDVSIFTIGFSGDQGTLFSGVPNDMLLASTLMRWGNFDTVNGAARFVSSEVPSGISPYRNAVPGTQALPPSFYLSAQPSFWGSMPWPAIGPDVSGGNISNVGGHAYLTPAANCYLNVMGGLTNGSTGILSFNANNCYPNSNQTSGNRPAPPSGLTGVVH